MEDEEVCPLLYTIVLQHQRGTHTKLVIACKIFCEESSFRSSLATFSFPRAQHSWSMKAGAGHYDLHPPSQRHKCTKIFIQNSDCTILCSKGRYLVVTGSISGKRLGQDIIQIQPNPKFWLSLGWNFVYLHLHEKTLGVLRFSFCSKSNFEILSSK